MTASPQKKDHGWMFALAPLRGETGVSAGNKGPVKALFIFAKPRDTNGLENQRVSCLYNL
jgi:hypothetical protein